MGIRSIVKRVGEAAGDKIAKAAVLSPEQVEDVQKRREEYLSQMPDPNDPQAVELTQRLLAASSVEIYNAYLPQLHDLYVPVKKEAEYEEVFSPAHNIRYFNITKWVTDKKENSLEKLVNVYDVLSNEECNIALIFHRGMNGTQTYLAVVNTKNAQDNQDITNYRNRIADAIRGNFPGAEWANTEGVGAIPCLNNSKKYSVSTATNIPTEKSEKFISQTIEKLLDGIIPDKPEKEYTLILLATPIQDIEERKLRLSEFYTGLAPYAGWSTNYTYQESGSTGSSATVGVNVGASAGIQHGQNSSETKSEGETDSRSTAETDSTGKSDSETTGKSETETAGRQEGTSESETKTHGKTHNEETNRSQSDSAGGSIGSHIDVANSVNSEATGGVNAGVNAQLSAGTSHEVTAGVNTEVNYNHTWNKGESTSNGTTDSTAKSIAKNISESISNAVSESSSSSVANTIGHAVANTLGKAVTKTASVTSGVFKSTNFGLNFGANFARSSNVTATIGKNEGITQQYTNYNIKHTLELLEEQMKRYEQSTALGMWDFAAYVLSEDYNVANNVAHSYLALTQGEKSYMSHTAVNVWRGDLGEQSADANEICGYLRQLRHPLFGLDENVVEAAPIYNVYPSVVTATTSLTGKELAYSLNFPKKSISGLPILECAEFGRNVVTYDNSTDDTERLHIGHIFHMNHEERTDVTLSKKSLASHVFITGSTGSGKSNTVYQLLGEAVRNDVKFLVVEPAKGEYKNVFGNDEDVTVYGTNPEISKLLRINPFSFPKGIHVFEHIDRLVEIFNVCWPMYAAMPAVLKSAIEQSYADCGWDLTNSVNPYGDNLYPTFSDVARNIRTIIDSSEYDAENKGAYKGSLLTRLKSLTNGINGMIFTSNEISDEDLFDKNVIVDLSRVGSGETKSLLMGMIVLKLQEHRMTQDRAMNGSLQHLTVLEEAHNLLKRTSTDQPVEGGNLLGKSVEMISNAIAEMRTYGEGFIIVDQAPGLLDMAAIRNTNTKIIMRLPDLEDRRLVGHAANLNDDQITELAKLPCGVGAVYQNEWVQAVLCKIKRYDVKSEKYQYQKSLAEPKEMSSEDALKIAELLSKGTQISQEEIVRDIRPKLNRIGMDASSQVTVYKMLLNSPAEPRMTKLAPVMSRLFPQAADTMQRVYNETSDASEWTRQVEQQLLETVRVHMDDQVRRDIIQCIVTDYLIHKINNEADFQKWAVEGGLH